MTRAGLPAVHAGETWWAWDMLVVFLGEWEDFPVERKMNYSLRAARCLVLHDEDYSYEPGELMWMHEDDFQLGKQQTRRVA